MQSFLTSEEVQTRLRYYREQYPELRTSVTHVDLLRVAREIAPNMTAVHERLCVGRQSLTLTVCHALCYPRPLDAHTALMTSSEEWERLRQSVIVGAFLLELARRIRKQSSDEDE